MVIPEEPDAIVHQRLEFVRTAPQLRLHSSKETCLGGSRWIVAFHKSIFCEGFLFRLILTSVRAPARGLGRFADEAGLAGKWPPPTGRTPCPLATGSRLSRSIRRTRSPVPFPKSLATRPPAPSLFPAAIVSSPRVPSPVASRPARNPVVFSAHSGRTRSL